MNKLITFLLFTTLSVSSAITVTVTSYNSLGGQTDSSPNITATGTRTRHGVVAASRDLITMYGYGSKVRFSNFRGSGCNPNAIPVNVRNMTFVVEDTMSPRFSRKLDIWLLSRSASLNFGHCVADATIF